MTGHACDQTVHGPDRRRDGSYVTRRCPRPAVLSVTTRKSHPQGDYDSTIWLCDRHAWHVGR